MTFLLEDYFQLNIICLVTIYQLVGRSKLEDRHLHFRSCLLYWFLSSNFYSFLSRILKYMYIPKRWFKFSPSASEKFFLLLFLYSRLINYSDHNSRRQSFGVEFLKVEWIIRQRNYTPCERESIAAGKNAHQIGELGTFVPLFTSVWIFFFFRCYFLFVSGQPKEKRIIRNLIDEKKLLGLFFTGRTWLRNFAMNFGTHIFPIFFITPSLNDPDI